MSWLLGLTGSIGMGKSTTAGFFVKAGYPVWDADAAVHTLYKKGGDAVEPIEKAFPGATENGAVSRTALKEILARDQAAFKRLEEIVHPLVAAHRQAFIESETAPILVFDMPLLFETNADSWLTSTLVVTAPEDVQRQRVLARPGTTEAYLDQMLARQLPDAEKRARADHVIETRSLEQTEAAVQALIEEILKDITHD